MAENQAVITKEEAELIAQWKQGLGVQQGSKFNSIQLVNQKINKETDAIDPNYGKLVVTRYGESALEKEGIETIFDISKDSFYPITTKFIAYSSDENLFLKESNDESFITVLNSVTKDVVESGSYWDLKEKYSLKGYTNLYGIINDQKDVFYKWRVSPSSIRSLKDAMKGMKQPTYLKISEIVEKMNPKSKTKYNEITFQKGDIYEKIGEAIGLGKTLREALDAIYNPKSAEAADAEGVFTPDVVAVDPKEIKPEDLPF